MANILICDDERDIVRALKIYLGAEGYSIYEAYNGQECLDVLDKEAIDLVLLDVMMPVMDGITCMTKLREKYNMPVIFLSAKSEDYDKILGLNLGADDYVTKPFNMVEVAARIKSNLRRYVATEKPAVEEILIIGGIVLNDRSKEVTVDGEPVRLSPKEYEILKLFMENPDKVFPPKEIYKKVWKEDPFGSESTVTVHIRHLREKVEVNPAEPRYIKLIWGQGYRLERGN